MIPHSPFKAQHPRPESLQRHQKHHVLRHHHHSLQFPTLGPGSGQLPLSRGHHHQQTARSSIGRNGSRADRRRLRPRLHRRRTPLRRGVQALLPARRRSIPGQQESMHAMYVDTFSSLPSRLFACFFFGRSPPFPLQIGILRKLSPKPFPSHLVAFPPKKPHL